MSQTAPNSITALPTPPSTLDPTNFDTRADAFLGQFPTLVTEVNNVASVTYNNAVDAYNNATTASAAAITAQQSATTAQAYAGATAWVSGTTYAIGDVRWSPGNGRIYRRITNGAGTTDPYNDPTNWSLVPTSVPITRLTSALVTQASSGMFYEFANSTTQGAATNLFLYSEQMNISGTWYTWHTSVTSNMTMAPDGNTTADKIVEDTAVSNRALQQNVTVAANQPYTMQVAVKAAGRSVVGLSFDKDSLGVDRVRANFNLTTGATSSVGQDGTGSEQSATCTYLGNGWYLCTLTGTASTSAGTYLRCIIHVNGVDVPYTGDGVSGIYVWGAQFESGSTATSYIPTTTTTATRSAGVVAPQRIVLPASPSADAWVKVIVANGIGTNIVDPNSSSIMGTNGPIQLDNPYASVTFQYSGSTWRMINA